MTQDERKTLAVEIHRNAVDKGFWRERFSPKHYLALAATEVGEAIEADRRRLYPQREAYERELRKVEEYGGTAKDRAELFEHYVKDTVGDELADAYIRLLDLAEGFDAERLEARGVTLPAYELFTESALDIMGLLSQHDWRRYLPVALEALETLATRWDIDLGWHIREKMTYNATRPPLHGKAY